MPVQSDKSTAKNEAKKLKETEQIAAFMAHLEHPLKAEIEAVRTIIKNANPKLSERIKWNAPSYYYNVDLLTFHLRSFQRVHLVFHNEAIVRIQSPLLEGDYKDRRMMYFKDMAEVVGNIGELEMILNEYVDLVEE